LSAAAKRKYNSIGIIDIFAGPGGLGEGFSSFEPKPGSGVYPFRLGVSAEMERSAHATLRLRAFYRSLRGREGKMPKAYAEYLSAVAEGRAATPENHFGEGSLRSLWAEAEAEALNLTLGIPSNNEALYKQIEIAKRNHERMVLIGGPPCQAYSLVGRARQRNVVGFQTHGDHRHFLYREYLGILAKFTPDVFIMENVKGILTSKVGGRNMFAAIQQDLSNPSQALGITNGRNSEKQEYVLLPIHVAANSSRKPEEVAADPTGFLIRCEDHGAPQARHRVIIMGVRADHAAKAFSAPGLDTVCERVTLCDALLGLPKLRSGLSKEDDDAQRWANVVDKQRRHAIHALGKSEPAVRKRLEAVTPNARLPRKSIHYKGEITGFSSLLRSKEQQFVLNHETRGHMDTDLGRYLFCAAFALEHSRSPTSTEFPTCLAPTHKNWDTGHFADRFRVQVKGRASSTVTSHLSKDGHAFIHWDPTQCRSLTVREAARLQTFPDDYLFLGNRTQQFVQVGNAVPPLVAQQIAAVVWSIVSK